MTTSWNAAKAELGEMARLKADKRRLEIELLDLTEIASKARAKNSQMRIALESVNHFACKLDGGREVFYAIPAKALKLVEDALKGEAPVSNS